METDNKERIPSRPVHPGEILWEELKERKIKQKDFARQIALQPTYLSEIIRGKRDLNESVAYKIEAALGVPYYFWMNLQNSYTYNKLQLQKRREAEKAAKAEGPKEKRITVPCDTYAKVAEKAAKAGLSVNAFVKRLLDNAVASVL